MPSVYVTEPGAMVETEAGRLLVTHHDEALFSAPLTRVTQVVLVGQIGVTTPALHRLLERRIPLTLLSSSGTFRGRLSPGLSGNAAVRRTQYRRLDEPEFRLALARRLVIGKVRNCRTLCLRWDTSNLDALTLDVAGELLDIIERAERAHDHDELMGLEGQASRRYFEIIRMQLGEAWPFPRRARRPPPDPVNALFSLLYTLLHESCFAALEAVALDPYGGALHADRHGRASLALDLMEEFRPLIADSTAMTLLNKGMLTPSDFHAPGNGSEGILLTREGWRSVAVQYNRRLSALIRPEGLTRRISYQKLLERQAWSLRRAFEGAADDYDSFLVK